MEANICVLALEAKLVTAAEKRQMPKEVDGEEP
jgi:hypothetical protein